MKCHKTALFMFCIFIVSSVAMAAQQNLPEAYRKVEQTNLLASRNYVPGPFNGKVILIRANQQPSGCSDDLTLGWGQIHIPGLEVHTVEGHHGNLLQPPFVDQVSDILISRLKGSADPQPVPERA